MWWLDWFLILIEHVILWSVLHIEGCLQAGISHQITVTYLLPFPRFAPAFASELCICNRVRIPRATFSFYLANCPVKLFAAYALLDSSCHATVRAVIGY
jgi:hypothetical protein